MKVLIVDDNESSALTLSWNVETFGCDVQVAYSGEAALKLAGKFKPDVVLLDIGMPVMNGFAVCKALRADAQLQSAVIIAQTGWGDTEIRLQIQQAGFDLHLVKPLAIDQLKTILSDIAQSRFR